MTHLPFIAASYALFLGIAASLAIGAQLRLAAATRRLAAVDTRSREIAR